MCLYVLSTCILSVLSTAPLVACSFNNSANFYELDKVINLVLSIWQL